MISGDYELYLESKNKKKDIQTYGSLVALLHHMMKYKYRSEDQYSKWPSEIINMYTIVTDNLKDDRARKQLAKDYQKAYDEARKDTEKDMKTYNNKKETIPDYDNTEDIFKFTTLIMSSDAKGKLLQYLLKNAGKSEVKAAVEIMINHEKY